MEEGANYKLLSEFFADLPSTGFTEMLAALKRRVRMLSDFVQAFSRASGLQQKKDYGLLWRMMVFLDPHLAMLNDPSGELKEVVWSLREEFAAVKATIREVEQREKKMVAMTRTSMAPVKEDYPETNDRVAIAKYFEKMNKKVEKAERDLFERKRRLSITRKEESQKKKDDLDVSGGEVSSGLLSRLSERRSKEKDRMSAVEKTSWTSPLTQRKATNDASIVAGRRKSSTFASPPSADPVVKNRSESGEASGSGKSAYGALRNTFGMIATRVGDVKLKVGKHRRDGEVESEKQESEKQDSEKTENERRERERVEREKLEKEKLERVKLEKEKLEKEKLEKEKLNAEVATLSRVSKGLPSPPNVSQPTSLRVFRKLPRTPTEEQLFSDPKSESQELTAFGILVQRERDVWAGAEEHSNEDLGSSGSYEV